MATYTGTVTPGGTPDTRELSHLIITKVAVDAQMSNNCYVLRCRATDQQVLIDAADDAPTLLTLLGSSGATKIITTHQHWDHHRALKAVAEATGAVIVAGEPDAAAITGQTQVAVDDAVEHGDLIEFGNVRLEVIRVTGHTPGSIVLLYDDPDGTPHLFTGDSLFPGGPGMTTSPADFDSLMFDLQANLFDRLPDETWFYPGHGNDSTLGAERSSIPAWLARRW